MDKHVEVLSDNYGIGSAPITPQMFASAGREHMEKYGIYMYMYMSVYMYSVLLFRYYMYCRYYTWTFC